VQATVEPAVTLLDAQATDRAVMVDCPVSEIVIEADFVASCTLVAFTVTEVPVDGGVSRPVVLMLPAEVDQFTEEE
jgi:hypothetical protein